MAEIDILTLDTDSCPDADRARELQTLLQQSHPGTLRRSQLEQILRMEERRRNEEERMQQEQYASRQNVLRRRGVSSQNVNLLLADPREQLPTPVRRDIAAFEDKQCEEELQTRTTRPKENIRSALVSKVQGKSSLISAKVSYNVSERASVEDIWFKICQKRDESDEAMRKIKGMAFFFSSVAVLERKAKGKEPNSGDKEDKQTEGVKTTKSKEYCPAISYWIAMQSPDGLQVSTVPVHSALLNTGMDVTAKPLPDCKRGREEYAVEPLCTTVKDHNNSFLQKPACWRSIHLIAGCYCIKRNRESDVKAGICLAQRRSV
ncbi:hypothetical protein ACROYT_G006359 [Oculina patagonica]